MIPFCEWEQERLSHDTRHLPKIVVSNSSGRTLYEFS